MKRFGFLALGGIMAALLMGQSQCNKGPLGTNLIEAEKVVLRNAMGSAELTPQSLSFLNSEGRPFVALIANRSTLKGDKFELVQLYLNGTNGGIMLDAGSVKPYISVSYSDDKAETFVSPADIVLWYAKKQRTELAASNSGTSISFYDPTDSPNNPRAELGIFDNGANLSLSDKESKTRAVLGSTTLVTPRTGTKTITSEESLTFFDKGGKVSWQTPR